MPRTKVLLVGESWVNVVTHYKGFDQFGSVAFELGADPLVEALRDSEFDLTYMPSHLAADGFPFTREGLDAYQAIILSDIGSNTLLLPQSVYLQGKPAANRLELIAEWTRAGGGLAMVGGYFSFQGIDGRARWRRTPVEAALPVTCLPYDDRIEVPEGFTPEIVDAAHPIMAGLGGDWPLLLGANEVVLREQGAHLLARLPQAKGGHPLLVTGEHGQGRTLAWTSDLAPHWVPRDFYEWPGYTTLWRNCLAWLTRAA